MDKVGGIVDRGGENAHRRLLFSNRKSTVLITIVSFVLVTAMLMEAGFWKSSDSTFGDAPIVTSSLTPADGVATTRAHRIAAPGESSSSSAKKETLLVVENEKPAVVTPLWSRRFISTPHASLFLGDDGLQQLLTVIASKDHVFGCQKVPVSSFLVATKVLEPAATFCHVSPSWKLCAALPPAVPLVHLSFMRLKMYQRYTTVNGTYGVGEAAAPRAARVSKRLEVQRWLEQVVGPLDFSAHMDVSLLREEKKSDPSSSSPKRNEKRRRRVHHHRTTAGFTVYNEIASEYVIFFPFVDVASASTAFLSGNASFSVKLLHDSFWGVNEVFHKTAKLHNHYVVSKGLRVEVPLSTWDRRRRPNGNVKGDTAAVGSSDDIAGCLHSINPEAADGALFGWWREHAEDEQEAAVNSAALRFNSFQHLKGYPMRFGNMRTENQNRELPLGVVKDVPPSASLLQSLPKHSPLPFSSASKIATSRATRWMVTGDSQSRSLYRALKDWVVRPNFSPSSAANASPAGGDEEKIRSADTEGPHSSLRVSYRWDNYLSNLSSTIAELNPIAGRNKEDDPHHRLLGTTVLLVGMGAHAASWGQYTFLQYQLEMQSVAAKLIAFLQGQSFEGSKRCPPRSSSVVVWYGAPAWPKPKNFDKFRITNTRLGLYNYLALEELERATPPAWQHDDTEEGHNSRLCKSSPRPVVIQTMDFFAVTLPVLKWSKDGSHYDKTMVMPAMVDLALSRVDEGV